MSAAFKQSNHLTIVSDDDSIASAKRKHPSNTDSKWVVIGGIPYEVTPQTRYTHLLANGRPYYPYYDPTLPTCDPPSYNPDDCSSGMGYTQ